MSSEKLRERDKIEIDICGAWVYTISVAFWGVKGRVRWKQLAVAAGFYSRRFFILDVRGCIGLLEYLI